MKTIEEVVKFFDTHNPQSQEDACFVLGFLSAKFNENSSGKCLLWNTGDLPTYDFSSFISWFNSSDENDPTSKNYVDWKAEMMNRERTEEAAKEETCITNKLSRLFEELPFISKFGIHNNCGKPTASLYLAFSLESGDECLSMLYKSLQDIMGDPEEEIVFEFEVDEETCQKLSDTFKDIHETYLASKLIDNLIDDVAGASDVELRKWCIGQCQDISVNANPSRTDCAEKLFKYIKTVQVKHCSCSHKKKGCDEK